MYRKFEVYRQLHQPVWRLFVCLCHALVCIVLESRCVLSFAQTMLLCTTSIITFTSMFHNRQAKTRKDLSAVESMAEENWYQKSHRNSSWFGWTTCKDCGSVREWQPSTVPVSITCPAWFRMSQVFPTTWQKDLFDRGSNFRSIWNGVSSILRFWRGLLSSVYIWQICLCLHQAHECIQPPVQSDLWCPIRNLICTTHL